MRGYLPAMCSYIQKHTNDLRALKLKRSMNVLCKYEGIFQFQLLLELQNLQGENKNLLPVEHKILSLARFYKVNKEIFR